MHFTLELEGFVYDCATATETEKLHPKGIAMHAYGISIYYVYTGS